MSFLELLSGYKTGIGGLDGYWGICEEVAVDAS